MPIEIVDGGREFGQMSVIVYNGLPEYGQDELIQWADQHKTSGFILNVPNLPAERDTFILHKASHGLLNNLNNGHGSLVDGKRYKVAWTAVLPIRLWIEKAFLEGRFNNIGLTKAPAGSDVKCSICKVNLPTNRL